MKKDRGNDQGVYAMIKVCHMTSAHNSNDIRIFSKECASLAKADYNVTLVARGASYEKNGVHVSGIGEVPSGRLKRMLFVSRKVYQRALEVDADIYHFHDPELLPYGLKLKKLGKKVIFDSHECYVEQIGQKAYLPKWIAHMCSKFYGVYEDHVLKYIDGLIFPCLKDGRNRYEGKCKNFALVNNVPLLEELYDQYDPSAEKTPASCCYVGGLTYARGITHLVQAADQAGVHLYLAGKFSSAEYQDEIMSMAKDEHVVYKGVLSRDEILHLLQSCQIGIATLLNIGQYNQWDNLATKVYEYMALSIPVILTDSPYNRKINEKYHFGICVDPANVDEIADAIRYILDHPDEAKKMGENGRRVIKEKFNWTKESENLLKLYEQIADISCNV